MSQTRVHPFDRYGEFTDVQALKEASAKPLRKSMRVNTLKISTEFFEKWAKEKEWSIQKIPWCGEGYFIDRVNREVALGKDLLHLLGCVYMQEAASMLPVELLDPQPGEVILDMSAAPGSKSTQIAAKLASTPSPSSRGGGGLLVCNDVQEKRLWTLKSALHRSGVTNAIVTRKVGQWFSKQMTERFDRVLCDAPCTAQGTARKDSDALDYCSPENIGKMAKLQRELLESAINACKVGGVIVYSTCTLTPEENEGVILSMLQRFEGRLEVMDPFGEDLGLRTEDLGRAIEDSHVVQKNLSPKSSSLSPMLRLWPQTYDTEGFFACALRKTATTKHVEKFDSLRFQEEELPASRVREWGARLADVYGTSFLVEGDRLFERGDQLLLATQDVAAFRMPVQDYSLGLPFGRKVGDDRIRLDHELVTLRGQMALQNVMDIDEATLHLLLDGKDAECDASLHGDVLLRIHGLTVGIGLAKEGKLKNRLPRWVVQKS